ncbi:hypothetical protein KTC96_25010 (plasmid) [Clostridium estertheticum]|uniref:hypothetical protein n=1 Tax=Clostridium estertheticum TaxID=238834 RepID=UPI001C7D14BC|nr:hypothetical protein [Clostridium estertheticum]MBX4259789.1 hypothetical protein [Clostridium estertheticum]WLC73281.1 hypothetical protein KTC96_25010 [Clostridium estertheticum]
MSCKCAKYEEDENRYYCDISGSSCMFMPPDSVRCATEYGEDISLINYCRNEYKKQNGCEIGKECSVEDFGEYMENDDFLSIFYWSCVGFAEVRFELMKYEDANVDIKEIKETIARNLVAWDTSKDKTQGLLPEVYVRDRYLYKQLTGEEYNFSEVCRKYHIEN